MCEKKEYRTTEQFNGICESMWNGQWTQASIEVVEFGFYENDLLTAYESEQEMSGEDYDSDLQVLKGIVTIVQMAAQIRYEDGCNFRPCGDCGDWGMPLPLRGLCMKCAWNHAYPEKELDEIDLLCVELDGDLRLDY